VADVVVAGAEAQQLELLRFQVHRLQPAGPQPQHRQDKDEADQVLALRLAEPEALPPWISPATGFQS